MRIISAFGIYSYCLLLTFHGIGQDYAAPSPIKLINASFEDTPKTSSPPMGWSDCGFTGESPPDVHPNNFWEVNKPAIDGKTYMGLVVRHNDTWERVSQLLEKPMVAGVCYNFNIYLSSSSTYKSGTNNRDKFPLVSRSDSTFNFDVPTVLRIWGANISCGRSELLAESNPVEHLDWKQYFFRLKPKSNYKYIMLEAFFKTPVLLPYNGNILMDHASDLIPADCEKPVEPQPIVVNKPKVQVPAPTPVKPILSSPPPVSFTPKPKVGEIIRINKLFFISDSATIPPQSFMALDDIYTFLVSNPSLVVEIGGHTNGVPPDWFCDSLSTLRAKAVAEYLIMKGVPKERMTYVGYGRRKPIDTNFTRAGKARNQRVELKILST